MKKTGWQSAGLYVDVDDAVGRMSGLEGITSVAVVGGLGCGG